MRLPTISAGKHKSSRMASCTAVKVRLLGLFCLFAFSVRLGQDPSLSNEDNRLSIELLLQLTHKASLDFLVRLNLWHWHGDDDGLLAAHVNFLCACNEKLIQGCLEI